MLHRLRLARGWAATAEARWTSCSGSTRGHWTGRLMCTGSTKREDEGSTMRMPRMTDLSGLGPKRFYKEVDVREVGERHVITVDDKQVRTTRGNVLGTPTRALSLAVAEEWDAQTDRIRPSSMPLTGMTSAAIDVVPEMRDKMENSILRFVHTDSCAVRPDTPRELVEAQNAAFEKVLTFVKRHARKAVRVHRGVLQGEQEEEVEAWVGRVVRSLDAWSLVAVECACACAKSAFVALALREGAVDAKQALQAARCEERWQAGVWGVVEGGHDVDDADANVRLCAADTLFRLVELDPRKFGRLT